MGALNYSIKELEEERNRLVRDADNVMKRLRAYKETRSNEFRTIDNITNVDDLDSYMLNQVVTLEDFNHVVDIYHTHTKADMWGRLVREVEDMQDIATAMDTLQDINDASSGDVYVYVNGIIEAYDSEADVIAELMDMDTIKGILKGLL